MDRRKFGKLAGLGTGAVLTGAYFSGCEKEPLLESQQEPYLKEVKSRILSEGLESPSGISLYNGYKKSSALKSGGNVSSLEDLVFCSGPIFNGDQSKFLVNPVVFNYIGDLSTKQILYEFTEEDISFFDKSSITPILNDKGGLILIGNEMANRPLGLSLDTAILGDGTIVFSSVSSDILLDLTGGVKQIYLQEDELLGTNNMIYGSDDKLYLAQLPIRDIQGKIIRPKRVVSLDSGRNLNVEFELPEGINSFHRAGVPESNSIYFGNYLEIGSQIRVIENLDLSLDSSKFYVIDQYSKAIYKVSDNNLVELLINTESYPSGIVSQINGNILYVTPPILYHPSVPYTNQQLAFSPQLIVLNPKDGKETILYTFGDGKDVHYQSSGNNKIVNISGQDYFLPRNFLVSLGAVQVDNNLNIYYTDNMSGELGEISAIVSS